MIEANIAMAVCLLAAVHIFAGSKILAKIRPSYCKSFGAGVGTAYAFLVLLPKLASSQNVLEAYTASGIFGFLIHHSYIVALLGLIIYYGFDQAAESLPLRPHIRSERPLVLAVVYANAVGFAGYYMLAGYLVSESFDYSTLSLSLFTIAMLLHFISHDHSIIQKFPGLYDRVLRWVFAVATILGWVLAKITEVYDITLALWLSFFTGSLIVITIREKIPKPGSGSFWLYIIGALGYAVLLILVDIF